MSGSPAPYFLTIPQLPVLHDPRLRNFLELAESILEYFRPYLGRIEIMGASRRIERIYFEISETNRAQWEMPQVSA